LLAARTNEVRQIIDEMKPYDRWVRNSIRYRKTNANIDPVKRSHLDLASLIGSPDQSARLADAIIDASPEQFQLMIESRFPCRDQIEFLLWKSLADKNKSSSQRLNAAGALAIWSPKDFRWPETGKDVATLLLEHNVTRLGIHIDRLTHVSDSLNKTLNAAFIGGDIKKQEIAALVLAEFQPPMVDLIEMVAIANPSQLPRLITGLTYRRKAEEASTVKELPPDLGDATLKAVAKKVLANEKYAVGKIQKLIVNSEKAPRDRIETKLHNGSLETVVRHWEEFQVVTLEIDGDELFVFYNTLKRFSRAPNPTPINQWILSKRFKLGRFIVSE
ncbi:MAG: hypothetical protein AAGA30_07935, partial [Planctomycetota bacterium]